MSAIPGETRFVTARDLGRRTAELLDAVESGLRLVVTRNGVPSAVIEATEKIRLLEQTRRRAAVEVFEPEEEPLDLSELDVPPEALEVLDALDRIGDNHDRIIRDTGLSVDQVLSSLGRLEAYLLTERTFHGYAITRLGERALAAWREGRA